jgi:hypothetical protein
LSIVLLTSDFLKISQQDTPWRSSPAILSFSICHLPDGCHHKADCMFGAADLTKSFISVAAMMLVDDGKLNLDDDVLRLSRALSKSPPA